MEVDASGWSGDGEFTQVLVDALRELPAIRLLKIEDAKPDTGPGAFSFISNEVFVVFERVERRVPVRRFGFFPGTARVTEKAMTLAALEDALTASERVGAPDYADDGMLQYLRTTRIVPPYQTRGYKLVELVRIYEAGYGTPGSGPKTGRENPPVRR